MSGLVLDIHKIFIIIIALGKRAPNLDPYGAYPTYLHEQKYSPGFKNIGAAGSVYANASLSLLEQGPSAGTIFWNL
jgi:hypothetical protein